MKIESVLTNQPGVITAGAVGFVQTFISTTMPVIQWIVATSTAILVLVNLALKLLEVYRKVEVRLVARRAAREEKKDIENKSP